jgi:hypothetical protein
LASVKSHHKSAFVFFQKISSQFLGFFVYLFFFVGVISGWFCRFSKLECFSLPTILFNFGFDLFKLTPLAFRFQANKVFKIRAISLSSIFNKLSFLFAKQVSESVFFSVDKVGF